MATLGPRDKAFRKIQDPRLFAGLGRTLKKEGCPRFDRTAARSGPSQIPDELGMDRTSVVQSSEGIITNIYLFLFFKKKTSFRQAQRALGLKGQSVTCGTSVPGVGERSSHPPQFMESDKSQATDVLGQA
jgi:hypothetical protein